MRLETIVRAALRDMQAGKAEPHCGEPSRYLHPEEPLRDIEWCEAYAEPGYDTPKNGVLFANWNHYPTRLTDILERAGYAIEWSDEWSTCESCNRAVRHSPDSYGWRRSYVLYHDCDIICADCVREDLGEYESHLLNNADRADTLDVDWSAYGFVRLNTEHYENGLHPGQTDNPHKIAGLVPKTHDFLFAIPSVGQFDVSFDCWIRPTGDPEDEPAEFSNYQE